ncbi:hypothetical protein LX97_02508 [Nonlabens dokdonensis]|jgi:hypothetical protein|uniref:Uncharacterized protein n=2 Tax=Nonlabens dokdonensis TaxID=328515 RepID=L7WEM7_NONDD|nr:hypothetical protein [Nonlabens dokdonensis]AGC78732.1 hypothetical protein DDD_3605 [Nonlabens dokdonensis DSW-6]PZX39142.1 hypothetical protein LX97_02508 [Nonlabens dokdonensis]
MTKSIITKGFILSGIVNTLGILFFTKVFTNDVIPETDPVVMSYFGLLMIMVWGVAFIAVAKVFEKVKWLIAVFALEKLCYVIAYGYWFTNNSLQEVYNRDFIAGVFYSIYGLNDFFFMLFFGYVFFKIKK